LKLLVFLPSRHGSVDKVDVLSISVRDDKIPLNYQLDNTRCKVFFIFDDVDGVAVAVPNRRGEGVAIRTRAPSFNSMPSRQTGLNMETNSDMQSPTNNVPARSIACLGDEYERILAFGTAMKWEARDFDFVVAQYYKSISAQ
jgi:hypothetical protein